MKKGFTMIELIFVIVILGILASVAIPRLASTRQDAEISSAIANLRTLQSDVSGYYVTNGSFAESFKTMSNVPIAAEMPLDTDYIVAYLKVGGDNTCITVGLRGEDKTDDFFNPAAMLLTPNNASTDPICQAVLAAPEVQKYTQNDIYASCSATAAAQGTTDCVNGKKLLGKGILIGSSTSVY